MYICAHWVSEASGFWTWQINISDKYTNDHNAEFLRILMQVSLLLEWMQTGWWQLHHTWVWLLPTWFCISSVVCHIDYITTKRKFNVRLWPIKSQIGSLMLLFVQINKEIQNEIQPSLIFSYNVCINYYMHTYTFKSKPCFTIQYLVLT